MFVNATGGRPAALTLPLLAALSVHVDDAPPTPSDMVPVPVTLIPVTLDAGRASVAPLTVTVTFEPDEPIVIAFVLPVGETFHTPRNATDVELVALLLASIGADAEIVTTPELALVTVTEHVPSALVTQDVWLRVALVGVALNETVAPDVGLPAVMTVATTLAFDRASATAGAVAVTTVVGVGDGVAELEAGVASLGLGEGGGVGPTSDIADEVGVHRLAIFDPFPVTGATAATVFDVSTAPAGAYVGAGVEGAAVGAGVGDGLVVADGCGLTVGCAVVVGRAEVDGAAVVEGAALGWVFADGFAEGLAIGAVVGARAGTVTGRGAGGCQSSGRTNVSPVTASYEMMRTPDSAAHAARLAASVGRRVML
jgi:hypothetical protein